MASLLSLPTELLSEIINLTLPDGIEAFALSCRKVQACATAQIRRHNNLRKTWRSCSGSSALVLLRLFGRSDVDPIAAMYVEVLDLKYGNYKPHDPFPDYLSSDDLSPNDLSHIDLSNADNDRTFFKKEENDNTNELRRIKEAVTGLQCLTDANIDPEQWWETMDMSDQEMVETGEIDETELVRGNVISLLGLLPNLKSLSLPWWWDVFAFTEGIETVMSALDAMVKGSNRAGEALAKLEVLMASHSAGYEHQVGIVRLEPLLALPTLKEVYLVSCAPNNDGPTFRWRYSTFNRALRRIELAYCCIDTEGIAELLKDTPHLEIFKYSHECKHHGYLYSWNAGKFVEAVGRQAGSTITQLVITTDETLFAIKNGAASFHSFPKLRELEVDVQIFCGPPVASGQQRSRYQEPPEGVEPWKEEQLPSLASMLPSSVANVQMNAHFEMSSWQDEKVALRALLTRFEEDRMARLPALSRLVVCAFDVDIAKEIVDGTGAKADVSKPVRLGSETPLNLRHELPAWKREFEQRAGKVDFFG